MKHIVVICLILMGCGGMQFTSGSAGDMAEGYKQQLALNPMRACTPHMMQEVWNSIRDDYYKPVTDKEIFIWGMRAVGVIHHDEALPDSEYGLYQFWKLLYGRKVAANKNLSELCYDAIRGMVDGLKNEYNEFVDVKGGEERFIRLMGQSYAGLGFLYTADPVGKRIYIDDIFPKSPAEKGGLLRYDEILAVDGVLVKNLDISKMSTIFRGAKGTSIVLTVARKGSSTKDIKFTRGMNNYKDAYCRLEQGIPYCRIYGFGAKTTENFEESFLALPKRSKRIIIDLRNNPGGWIFTATKMLGKMFLGPNFSTVFIKRKYGAVPFNDNYPSLLLKDYKVVVLINRGTVSSSELFIAALKDYKLGTLVGERTYGKGVSQKTTVIYGAMLSVVFAYFLSPLGHIIDKYGVEPDISVPFYLEHLRANKDPQLEKALELLK